MTDNQSNKGLTLTETMVVIAIFSIMALGLSAALSAGRTTWFDTDASIELRQGIRQAFERMNIELRETGFNQDGIRQFTILNNTGFGGADILTFSIPILCGMRTLVIDETGEIPYWGAPLKVGCGDKECTDPDNDCNTFDYKYIRYLVNDKHQLMRQVLDDTDSLVKEDILARNIIDFQVSGDSSSQDDMKLFDIRLSAQKKSAVGHMVTESWETKMAMRNGR